MTVLPANKVQGMDMPPVQDNLFCVNADGTVELVGGQCPACRRYYFPQPDVCPDCQHSIEKIGLGHKATIYSHTTVRTKPPFGLPQPYSVAYVDLAAAPLRIFVLLDPTQAGNFQIGDNLALRVAAIGHNGDNTPCLRPYFTHSDT